MGNSVYIFKLFKVALPDSPPPYPSEDPPVYDPPPPYPGMPADEKMAVYRLVINSKITIDTHKTASFNFVG
jgi:hypothetical protein